MSAVSLVVDPSIYVCEALGKLLMTWSHIDRSLLAGDRNLCVGAGRYRLILNNRSFTTADLNDILIGHQGPGRKSDLKEHLSA